MIDAEELIRRLEEVGENEVRKRLASNIYGPEKKPIVEEWLKSKERKREQERFGETLLIARSAKHAAWVAAIAAVISALAAAAAWISWIYR